MVKFELKSSTDTRIMIAKTGKNLREFAKHIGISQSYLSQILKGDRKPSPMVANKIAEGLDQELYNVFFIKNDNKRYILDRESLI